MSDASAAEQRSQRFAEAVRNFAGVPQKRFAVDDIGADISLSEVTKQTILSYPLPDQQPAEIFRIHLPSYRRRASGLWHRPQRRLT